MSILPRFPEKSPFRVIIVGAGLSGSLLANGLLKHDIDVRVYERLSVNSEREGYQITLGAPALKGFRACLTQEHIDSLVGKFGRAGGRKSRAPIIYDKAFTPLIDLTRLPNYSKSAPINRRILRDSLAEPVEKAGRLTYSRVFSHYEIVNAGTADERVRVYFDGEGAVDECDVLIGADGSHSRINAQIGLDNLKTLTSHWNLIVKTELSTKAILRLPKPVLEKQVLTFANNKSLYFSENSASDSKDPSQQVDESLLSCMLAVHLPTEQCPSDIANLNSNAKLDLVASLLGDWAKEYHDMIGLVRGSEVYAYRSRVSSRPAADWREKIRGSTEKKPIECGHPRVWLFGDACHAMLPTRGMGGNQAMQDTVTALRLLTQLATEAGVASGPGSGVGGGRIAAACTEFEAEMIPRAFEWVMKSGGDSAVPIDTATILGKLFFFFAAQFVNVAVIWYGFVGLFVDNSGIDDAPELRN